MAGGEEIVFPSNGENTRGYLAVPAAGRGPGVIVIQEWWGLVPHIRDVCDRFAREGFVALAPDLYRGDSTQDPDEAGRLMMGLEIPRAARDLDGAVQTLLGHDAVDGARVGAVGFCMGGQLALYAATRNPRVGAVADFYGVHPNVTLDLSNLQAAVLGIFAENDGFVTPEAARKLESDLKGAGVRTSFHVLPGVDHAFFNDTRPDVYDAGAAARAWAETRRALLPAALVYRYWLRVETHGIEKVPPGRVLLIGNHAGNTFAWDGAMLGMAMLLEAEPPRLVRGMAEYYLPQIPYFTTLMHRTGSVVGTPENCVQLLDRDEAVMVFPEGQRRCRSSSASASASRSASRASRTRTTPASRRRSRS